MSVNVGVTWGGVPTVGGGISGSKSHSEGESSSKEYAEGRIKGGEIKIETGDMKMEGGSIEGESINIKAEDVKIGSVQDEYSRRDESSEISAGINVGGSKGESGWVGNAGGNLGVGRSKSESSGKNVKEQAGIEANKQLEMEVGNKLGLNSATLGGKEGSKIEAKEIEIKEMEDSNSSKSEGYKAGGGYSFSFGGGSTQEGGSSKAGKSKGSKGVIGSINSVRDGVYSVGGYIPDVKVEMNNREMGEISKINSSIGREVGIESNKIIIDNEDMGIDSINREVENNRTEISSYDSGYNLEIAPKQWTNNLGGALSTTSDYIKLGGETVKIANKVGENGVKYYKIGVKYITEGSGTMLDYFFAPSEEELAKAKYLIKTKEEFIKDDMYKYTAGLQVNGEKIESYNMEGIDNFAEEIKEESSLSDKQYDKYIGEEAKLTEDGLRGIGEIINETVGEYNEQIDIYTEKLIGEKVKEDRITGTLDKLLNEKFIVWDNYRIKDAGGEGIFGSSRLRIDSEGKPYKDYHYGQDILSQEGYLILAPISGKIDYINKVYTSDAPEKRQYLHKVQIDYDVDLDLGITRIKKPRMDSGSPPTFTMFYIKSDNVNLKVGDRVKVGQIIAEAQSLQPGYSKEVPHHVHVQLGLGSVKLNGKLDYQLDPVNIWNFERIKEEVRKPYEALINSGKEVNNLKEITKPKPEEEKDE